MKGRSNTVGCSCSLRELVCTAKDRFVCHSDAGRPPALPTSLQNGVAESNGAFCFSHFFGTQRTDEVAGSMFDKVATLPSGAKFLEGKYFE